MNFDLKCFDLRVFQDVISYKVESEHTFFFFLSLTVQGVIVFQSV